MYPEHDTIRLVLDNHSAHTSKETRAFLETRPERFVFVFTSTHGSWLNLIESFFGKMARQCLHGICVESKQELIDRIYKYCDEINAAPEFIIGLTKLMILPYKILRMLKLIQKSDTRS